MEYLLEIIKKKIILVKRILPVKGLVLQRNCNSTDGQEREKTI